jgi:hypothetical protein
MLCRGSIGAIALMAVLGCAVTGAQAQGSAKYPEWFGQWSRTDTGPNRYDQSKPGGRGQQAPLTAEYQAVFDANMADQETGGQGTNITHSCLPGGLVRDMSAVHSLEFVVTPKITYVLFGDSMPRRIYTDGRDWPKDFEPSFMGYSIGKWTEPDPNGRYRTLEVETRLLKGPRAYDFNGIPLHADNETVVKERIYLDKADPDTMHDEITTFDHALTHPWKIVKNYVRVQNPIWFESICAESNEHIRIGKESYMMSADGYLMPAKKGQSPPDLRYFKDPQK